MRHIPKAGEIKIALLRIGGIGDALHLAAQASAVRRKYPKSHITLFVRDMEGRNIVSGHPAVDHIVIVGNKKWGEMLSVVRGLKYDIV